MDNSFWINLGGVISDLYKLGYNNYTKGKNIYGDNLDSELLTKYWSSQSYAPSIELGKLQNILKKRDVEQILINEAIYLPPLLDFDEDCIPTLTMECDTAEEGNHRFLFTLIKFSNPQEEPCMVGYRFEKHSDQPSHNYWHVQLNDSLGYSSTQLTNLDLPGHIPCILTIGEDPISLLSTALFSLYGKDTFNALLKRVSLPRRYVSHLGPYLR